MVATRMDESVRRRVRAGRMLLAGKTPAQAAHAVGVARQTAYTWKAKIWRILGGLGFSVQKPDRHAIERDADAVATWAHKTWPGLKKKPSERAD